MIRGLVFDKDGTLFDFKTTWNAWSAGLIRRFSDGDPEREAALAAAAHFDMARQSFLPSSPIIAGTNREAAEIFASVVTEHSVEELEDILMNATLDAPQAGLFHWLITLRICVRGSKQVSSQMIPRRARCPICVRHGLRNIWILSQDLTADMARNPP